MTHVAEPFAWCMLQVTAFTFVAACVYGVASRCRWGGEAGLLTLSLGIVGLLTLLSISPWPRWDALDFDGMSQTNARHTDRATLPHGGLSLITPTDTAASPIAGAIEELPQNQSVEWNAPHVAAAEAASREYELRTTAWPPWWAIVVVAAWAGTVIGLARFLIGLASLWHYRRASVAIDDRSMCDLAEKLGGQMKLRREISLRESCSLGVAATCGWRTPIILLPVTWREWTPDERRAVLAHELAHIRQRHFPKWLCSQLVVVAHYYHPLVHWLARRLRFEQEIAADRLAVRVFGRGRRYATVLAGLALPSVQPCGPFASLGLFMSRPFLMRRLAMLRQTPEPNHRHSLLKRGIVLALVALTAVAAAGVRAGQPADADQPPATPPSETGATPLASTTRKAPALDCYATALFQVSREPKRMLGSPSTQSDAAWEIFSKTQVALLKSYLVLQSAVRKLNVAELPLLASADEPVGVLAQRLEVGFYPGSEILYIRMACSRAEAEDVVQIVDAVAKAYEDEVIFSNRQRQLATRDLLARSLQKLKEEISRKMEEYYDITREAGVIEGGPGQVAQQLDLKRLDRIEVELMRLENDQLELQTSGESGNMKFYEQRIAQLRERQAGLEKRIMSRSETSVDVSERRRDLEHTQRIADELSTKLELMDIEANAPGRIEKIQPAVVTEASQQHSAAGEQ